MGPTFEVFRADVSDPLVPPRPPLPPSPLKILPNPSRPLEGGTPPPPLLLTAGGVPPPPLPGGKPQKVSKGGPLRIGRYSGILIP